jgi:UDP-N-acetylglucosamine 2-epimerase
MSRQRKSIISQAQIVRARVQNNNIRFIVGTGQHRKRILREVVTCSFKIRSLPDIMKFFLKKRIINL